MTGETGCILVMCACGSKDEAAGLATALIEARLAACVQLLPVQSFFRWDGKSRDEAEHLLLVKSVRRHQTAIEALILARHSYDLPEISVIDIANGSAAYLNWIVQETA